MLFLFYLATAIYVSGYDLCYPVSGASLGTWLHTLSTDYLLVIDPGPLVAEIPPERLARALARCDILSLNAREIALLTGIADIAEAAKKLVPRLAPGGYVVARSGVQGCWIASDTITPTHLPARPIQAVDTTGAGDAHVAALLTRLSKGNDMLLAARVANIAASLAVEKIGPATGPTSQELDEQSFLTGFRAKLLLWRCLGIGLKGDEWAQQERLTAYP